MPSGRPKKITKGVIDYTGADQLLLFRCKDAIQDLNDRLYALEEENKIMKAKYGRFKEILLSMLRKADTVLNPKEAAAYLDVLPTTLRQYVKEGRLKPIRYNFSGRRCGYGYSRVALDLLNQEALDMIDEGGNEIAYDFLLEPPSNKIIKAVRQSIARDKRERRNVIKRARLRRIAQKENKDSDGAK